MARIKADRVHETSITTGTGAFTLLGAVSSYRSFGSVMSVGDTCMYCIANQGASEWETGIGTYSGTNTLTRTTVIDSSNSGSVVTFSAGTKDVFITLPAKDSMYGSQNVYFASQYGVADCDIANGIKIGGGTPTDNATVLNGLLALATSTNHVTLVLDGGFAVKHGLTYPSTGNFSIVGLGYGTGVFIMNGSNSDGIRSSSVVTNADYNNVWNPGLSSQSILGSNVTLRNFSFYLNRGNVANNGGTGITGTGNVDGTTDGTITTTTAAPDGRGLYTLYPPVGAFNWYWFVGANFQRLDKVTVEDVQFYDSPSYAAIFFNCTNVTTRNNKIISPSGGKSNTDGFHFDGGCQYITVDGDYMNSADDCVALNFAEGNGQAGGNATVSNIKANGNISVVRVYGDAYSTPSTYSAAPCKNIVITNCTGNTTLAAMFYGVAVNNSKTTKLIESVRMSNCEVNINFASVNLAWTEVGSSGNSLILDGCTILEPQHNIKFIRFAEAAGVNEITVDVKAVRNTFGSSLVSLLGNAADPFVVGSIGTLTINGFSIADEGSYSSAPFAIYTTGGTIANVWIENFEPAHVSDFCNDYTKITSIGGPGVLATGYQFPDSVIANGTIYLSSTQGGAVCLKINGNVIVLPEISRLIFSVSTNTTGAAAAATDYVYLVSGTTTLTLPTAVGNTNRYTVKNVGTGVVTTATTSAQTIDGSSTSTLGTQYFSEDYISNGSNWSVI